MRIPLVLGTGVLAVLVAVGVVLIGSAQRQAGSNYVPEFAQALTIDGPGEHCQDRQMIPGERGITVFHPGLRAVVSFDTHSLSAGPDLPTSHSERREARHLAPAAV